MWQVMEEYGIGELIVDDRAGRIELMLVAEEEDVESNLGSWMM